MKTRRHGSILAPHPTGSRLFPQQTAKAEKRSVRFRFRKQSARRAPGPFKKTPPGSFRTEFGVRRQRLRRLFPGGKNHFINDCIRLGNLVGQAHGGSSGRNGKFGDPGTGVSLADRRPGTLAAARLDGEGCGSHYDYLGSPGVVQIGNDYVQRLIGTVNRLQVSVAQETRLVPGSEGGTSNLNMFRTMSCSFPLLLTSFMPLIPLGS